MKKETSKDDELNFIIEAEKIGNYDLIRASLASLIKRSFKNAGLLDNLEARTLEVMSLVPGAIKLFLKNKTKHSRSHKFETYFSWYIQKYINEERKDIKRQ